jgi:general secretion pathway protein A
MYARFFGLTAEPFSLSPDPSFFFLSDSHANALAALKIGICGRRGIMVMSGEVGTGKTTLLYSLLGDIGPRIRTAYVSNTKLGFDDMLRLALTDFGVQCPGRQRVDLLEALNGFLRRCAEENTIAALIVDEAQNLDDDTFEHVRLLSNFETFAAKLLQIILVGQPELEFKLQQPHLRQVAERVAVRCHLDPLSRTESDAYLDHRLRKAEARPDLFSAGARRLIFRAAQGIPRRINILCDNALLFAYGRNVAEVSRAEARLAVRERAALFTSSPLRRPAGTPATVRTGSWGWSRLAAAALVVVTAGGAMHWWSGLEPVVQLATSEPRPIGDVREVSHSSQAVVPHPSQAGTEAEPAAVQVEADAASPPASGGVALAAPIAAKDEPPTPATESERRPLDEGAPRVDAVAQNPEIAAGSTPCAPGTMGRGSAVIVPVGATLSSLTREVYGLVDADLIARIRSANPHLVDPNHIEAGDTLRFPAVDQPVGRPEEEHP